MTATGWRLHRFESLASTSDLCRSLAEEGEPDGLAVLAGRQTAGRGSRGRAWTSEPGNLYLSVLLRPSDRPRDAGLWALLAGVAVAESLNRPDIALKWPNDILRDGAKCGGILVESATDPEGALDWLIIGIGINLLHVPEIEGRTLTSLGAQLDADALAARILDRLTALRRLRLVEGWSAIRAAWLKHALPLGALMTLRRTTGDVSGRFAGVAEDGSLLLETAGRVHGFSTGEIWQSAPTR